MQDGCNGLHRGCRSLSPRRAKRHRRHPAPTPRLGWNRRQHRAGDGRTRPGRW
jgi:hypothetical protein